MNENNIVSRDLKEIVRFRKNTELKAEEYLKNVNPCWRGNAFARAEINLDSNVVTDTIEIQ